MNSRGLILLLGVVVAVAVAQEGSELERGEPRKLFSSGPKLFQKWRSASRLTCVLDVRTVEIRWKWRRERVLTCASESGETRSWPAEKTSRWRRESRRTWGTRFLGLERLVKPIFADLESDRRLRKRTWWARKREKARTWGTGKWEYGINYAETRKEEVSCIYFELQIRQTIIGHGDAGRRGGIRRRDPRPFQEKVCLHEVSHLMSGRREQGEV